MGTGRSRAPRAVTAAAPRCHNRTLGRVGVLAVEGTAAQVCWAGLARGTVLRTGVAEVTMPAGGSAGAACLEGLPPAVPSAPRW